MKAPKNPFTKEKARQALGMKPKVDDLPDDKEGVKQRLDGLWVTQIEIKTTLPENWRAGTLDYVGTLADTTDYKPYTVWAKIANGALVAIWPRYGYTLETILDARFSMAFYAWERASKRDTNYCSVSSPSRF